MTLDEELAAAMERVAKEIRENQTELDPEAKRILYANRTKLYRRSEPDKEAQ